jgi:hypothetical protein
LTKRKGIRKRTIDESSVVEVNDWHLPHTPAFGALGYLISSCNVCGGNMCHGENRWGKAIVNRVDRRLRLNDGYAKGRAIFLLAEDFWGRRTAVAVLLYHLPEAGTVEVLMGEAASDIWPERHDVFVAALLICGARVARESGGGDSALLKWTVGTKRVATDTCRRYDFTEQTRDSQGYHLIQRFDYG